MPVREDTRTAPLSHHEILAAAAPFVRAGCRVDLGAGDRAERRIVLRPAAAGDPALALALRFELEALPRERWRVLRFATDAQGLEARLQGECREQDLAALAARCAEVSPALQFEQGDGWAAAWSLRLPAGARALPEVAAATLRLDGLTLEMSVPAVDRIAATITLRAPGGDIAELPSDLLAVLGLRWARLDRVGATWRSSLVLRERGPARGVEAQAQLRLAAAHLARTLAEPPAAFHDSRVGARWAVTARRAVPLAAIAGTIAAALAVPALDLPPDSVWRMLIFNSPPLMLGLLVVLREMPRVELPPLPRRPAAASWRNPTARSSEG